MASLYVLMIWVFGRTMNEEHDNSYDQRIGDVIVRATTYQFFTPTTVVFESF